MIARKPNVARRVLPLLFVVGTAMAVGYGMGMRSTRELSDRPRFSDWLESVSKSRERRTEQDRPVERPSEKEEVEAEMPAVGYGEMRRSDAAGQRSWDMLIASASDLRRYADADPNVELGSRDPMVPVGYGEMRIQQSGPTSQWESELAHLPTYDYHRCITCHDPHAAEVQPNQEDKLESLAIRATRRAFNGAPPVVPHPVERTDDAACYACHNQGVQIGDRVANRMSHSFLSNCVQCHAAPVPQALAAYDQPVENRFVGLKTPQGGERAFADAPPVIPHSTWMRERCLSCHGGIAGWPGLEVSHRWRTNCTQCHAVSATLEQSVMMDRGVTGPAAMASMR